MDPEITVYAVDEYEPLEFDAVLIQDNVVVCLEAGERVCVLPLDKVNHVDADPDLLLAGTEIPEAFFGGGEYGFVKTSEFPQLEAHLDEIEREQY